MNSLEPPMIGVVCYGNILRSQVVAAYLRAGLVSHGCLYYVYDAGVCDNPVVDFPNAAETLYEVEKRLWGRGLQVHLHQSTWSDTVASQLANCKLILAADTSVKHTLRQRLPTPQPPLYGFYELFSEGLHDFPDTYDYTHHVQHQAAFDQSFDELERVARRLLDVLPSYLCINE